MSYAEILDDRVDRGSTLIPSRFRVGTGQSYLGEPTAADAILDRRVRHSYRIRLKVPGESRRKIQPSTHAGTSPRAKAR